MAIDEMDDIRLQITGAHVGKSEMKCTYYNEIRKYNDKKLQITGANVGNSETRYTYCSKIQKYDDTRE